MIETPCRCGSVVIEPGPDAWAEAIRTPQLNQRSERFRQQLGLPIDRPIVMTGHQAQLWHPGILAKYIAVDEASKRFGAHPAHIVVDQDANEWATIRFPVRRDTGEIVVRTWRVAQASADGRALACEPAFVVNGPPVLPPGETHADATMEIGLDRIAEALRSADGANASHKIANALEDLLRPLISDATTIFATSFARTDLFRDLVRAMREDPVACVRAYNDAVARFRARV